MSSLRRPFTRHRHSWKDNIRMDLQDVGSMGVDWRQLAQDRNQWHAPGAGACQKGLCKQKPQETDKSVG